MTASTISSNSVEALPRVTTHSRRRRTSGELVVGVAIVSFFVLMAVVSLFWTPYDPLNQDTSQALLPPAFPHVFGTDELGRDVLSRIMAAAAVDLPVTAVATLLPCVVGTILGLIAGYFSGIFDTIILRIGDLLQAFPQYVLMIVLVFVLGAGAPSIIVSFTLIGWVIYARIARTEVNRIKESQYIMSAKLSGFSSTRILARHVFPNVCPQILIYLTSDLVFSVVALAAFSFIGFGIQQPTPEWGSMIAAGQRYLGLAPWLVVIPGICLALFAFGLALIGDALQDRLSR